MIPAITTYVNVSPAISEQVATDVQVSLMFMVMVGYLMMMKELIIWRFIRNGQMQNMPIMHMQTGWLTAFFCEGLNRLAEEGKDVTWANYMAALEEAPLPESFWWYN